MAVQSAEQTEMEELAAVLRDQLQNIANWIKVASDDPAVHLRLIDGMAAWSFGAACSAWGQVHPDWPPSEIARQLSDAIRTRAVRQMTN